jgi:hypothetical protein
MRTRNKSTRVAEQRRLRSLVQAGQMSGLDAHHAYARFIGGPAATPQSLVNAALGRTATLIKL